MGRVGAKPIHQFQVQPQNDQHQLQPHLEYTYQVESFDHHQAPETIDEIPPQSIEPFHEDLYSEESQHEPPQELTMPSESQENQDSVQQRQYVQEPQPASRPVTREFSQQNGKTQRPRKQPKPQSGTPRSPIQPSQHNSFPIHDPQSQAENFPPPQSQLLPHPFLPAQDSYEPHTFPPTEEEAAHTFPPTVPQAFPPAQDCYEPHGFPPTLEGREDFPQTPNKANAFPPPQVDPQLYTPQAKPQAFVPQNHNVPAFVSSQPQAGTNFPQHSLGRGSQIGMGMGQYPQGTPSASPMPQTSMMGIPSKPLLPTESWKTGLFDCMEDPTNALITACFPCVTFGQIAEIVDYGQTTCTTSGLIYGAICFFIAIPCIMSCTYRTKLRSQYGLIESPAPDWIIHCLCECCALCQEYRELHLRGLDPSIGWLGNQARKQNIQLQQTTMVPPVHQAMKG